LGEPLTGNIPRSKKEEKNGRQVDRGKASIVSKKMWMRERRGIRRTLKIL